MTAPTHPRHRNGRPDRRYSIAREYCGFDKPQWVVRFCGDWIGRAAQRADAVSIALGHQASRNRRLGIPTPPSSPSQQDHQS